MSTEIQRYEHNDMHTDDHRDGPSMLEAADGSYVLFSDHEKALNLLRSIGDDAIAALRTECSDAHTKTEVELARGQQWCADFIAMRKERDQLQCALAEVPAERDRLKAELDRLKKRAKDLAIRMSL